MTTESIAIVACKDEMTRRASFAPEKVNVWIELCKAATLAGAIAILFIGCALIGF